MLTAAEIEEREMDRLEELGAALQNEHKLERRAVKAEQQRDSLAIDLRETEASLTIMRDRAEEAERQRDELLRVLKETSAHLSANAVNYDPDSVVGKVRAALAKIKGGDNAKG